MWPEDRHIEIIRLRLQQGGVRNERLLAELTDHVCCYLERQEGDDFEVLLDQGFSELAPNGVHEIEEERFFLFHFNKQLTMKRLVFGCGFAACFLWTTGFTFKLMHWPASSILYFGGNLFLIITAILVAITALGKWSRNPVSANIRILVGLIAALLIGMGSIFKLFHWPSANIQFILGVFLLNFIFLPLLFFQAYKQSAARQ